MFPVVQLPQVLERLTLRFQERFGRTTAPKKIQNGVLTGFSDMVLMDWWSSWVQAGRSFTGVYIRARITHIFISNYKNGISDVCCYYKLVFFYHIMLIPDRRQVGACS